MSAVALGLYEKGEIVFGVVYNPFTDELFHGAKGEGAYLNDRKIHVSDDGEAGDAVNLLRLHTVHKIRGEESLSDFFTDIFMKCGDFRRTGSAELDVTRAMWPAEESMVILNGI